MKWARTRRLGCLSAFMLALAYPAKAGPDEDRLTRQVVAEAAESYAKDRVASLVNQAVGSSAAPLGTVGGGTAIFATIDLGSAIYDFSKADTDKQRTYAGSRAALSGYALLGGPAAPILAVTLLAASLIEAGLAARDQAEMLRILEQIQRNVARIIEIERQLVEADAVQYRFLLSTAIGALAEYNDYAVRYKNNCGEQAAIQTLSALDDCVAALGRSMLAAQLFVETADELQQWRKGSGAFFVALDERIGYDERDIEEVSLSAAKMLADVKPVFDSMLKSFAQVASELTISGALDSAAFPTSEWVHMSCIDEAMAHARQGTTLLLQAKVLGERVNKSRLGAYQRAVDLYEESICTKASAMSTPYSVVLETWNVTVRNTRREVMRWIAKS